MRSCERITKMLVCAFVSVFLFTRRMGMRSLKYKFLYKAMPSDNKNTLIFCLIKSIKNMLFGQFNTIQDKTKDMFAVKYFF